MILSHQKRRTGTGLQFTKSRVKTLRQSRGIPAFSPTETSRDDAAIIMTVEGVAKEFRVDKSTVYRWLRDGFIVGEQLTQCAPWQIRIDDDLRAKICERTPAGWLRLDDAAKELGVARQTVLHKVQRGELKAVYVRKGKRKGLRIQVKRDEAGLFA
jgi:transposase